jgi:hypothetical protein
VNLKPARALRKTTPPSEAALERRTPRNKAAGVDVIELPVLLALRAQGASIVVTTSGCTRSAGSQHKMNHAIPCCEACRNR